MLLTHGSRKAGAAKETYTHNNNPYQQQPMHAAAPDACGCAHSNETNVMKKTIIRLLTLTKWALVGAALFAAFAWAGKSDYVDSTVVEMKNNGTYYALSERFPDYSDADLVHYYVEHYK